MRLIAAAMHRLLAHCTTAARSSAYPENTPQTSRQHSTQHAGGRHNTHTKHPASASRQPRPSARVTHPQCGLERHDLKIGVRLPAQDGGLCRERTQGIRVVAAPSTSKEGASHGAKGGFSREP